MEEVSRVAAARIEEHLPGGWVVLNVALLVLFMLVSYLSYFFIFRTMRAEVRSNKAENAWGRSLGVSDLVASIISLPLLVAGLVLQEEFLPGWMCNVQGFIDNLYLVSSVWTIVMWSLHRCIFMTRPLSTILLHTVHCMIKGVWVGAILMAAFPLILSEPYVFSPHSFSCVSRSDLLNLSNGTLNIILPLLLISIIFPKTYLITWRMDKRKPCGAMHCPTPYIDHVASVGTRMEKLFLFSDISENNSSSQSSADQEATRLSLFRKKSPVSRFRPMKSITSNCPPGSLHITQSLEVNVALSPVNERMSRSSYCTVADLTVAGQGSSDDSTVFTDTPQTPFTLNKEHRLTPPSLFNRIMDKGAGRKVKISKVVRGSRRTLMVLLCLFCTQVMSTLPIFLLFLLVKFNGSMALIPSQKQITLMTTLLVGNCAFNPVIRIIIKPAYNLAFWRMIKKKYYSYIFMN